MGGEVGGRGYDGMVIAASPMFTMSMVSEVSERPRLLQ